MTHCQVLELSFKELWHFIDQEVERDRIEQDGTNQVLDKPVVIRVAVITLSDNDDVGPVPEDEQLGDERVSEQPATAFVPVIELVIYEDLHTLFLEETDV